MANANLTAAKTAKNDEFYTRLEDIEKECHHYKEHFRGKTIYCNCDDPCKSNFFSYFVLNFEYFGLKKLISTGYNANGHGVACIYEGGGNDNIEIVDLKGSGDFRSDECVEFLKESDIVISNPPFSYFRVYVALLMMYSKQFLIVGNMNAITYKEVFPLIKDNKLWLGVSNFNRGMYFNVPDDYVYAETYKFEREMNGERVMRVPSICWYTNLPHNRRNQPLTLCHWYEKESENYPQYDNYDAIEVNNVYNIPADYQGIMAVPITFLDKYCSTQFEILGNADDKSYYPRVFGRYRGRIKLNDKEPYKRIFIRNLHPVSYNDYFNDNF